MLDQLTIGELAQRTGLAPSTLRYYEELGLVRPSRRVSGRRRYDASTVELVGVIMLMHEVGFTLAETATLLASRSKGPNVWRAMARRKLAVLEDRIASAQLARTAIRHALRCPHEDIVTCPNFARVLAARLAGKPLAEGRV